MPYRRETGSSWWLCSNQKILTLHPHLSECGQMKHKELFFWVCVWKTIALLSILQFMSLHLYAFWLSHNHPFNSSSGHLRSFILFYCCCLRLPGEEISRCGRAIKRSFGQEMAEETAINWSPLKSSKYSMCRGVHGKTGEPTLPCEEEKSLCNTARCL